MSRIDDVKRSLPMVMADVAIGDSAVRTPRPFPSDCFSAGQTFSWHREADDDALWLPDPGDFASKACNYGANEKIAEPVLTRRSYDLGSPRCVQVTKRGLSVIRTLVFRSRLNLTPHRNLYEAEGLYPRSMALPWRQR